MADATTHNLAVTRIFDAPVEQVWKAWSDSAWVMRWWGPTGFSAPLAEMDFRVGGTSLVCMRAPQEFGGQDLYNTWTYTKIVPMEQIEFINRFADAHGHPVEPVTVGLPPELPREVPHAITFKALSDGKTELTVREFGYPSAQLVELSRGGMEQCLDKMAALFAKP